MTDAGEVRRAYEELCSSLDERFPQLVDELRPPMPFSADWLARPGAEQLAALWACTSGQADGLLGALGGLRLLGPADSEHERRKWEDLVEGEGLDAVANPVWDDSMSADPTAVRGVYFANGWIPLLCEPLEANYLAVDLVPLEGGHAGQVILCGRDEDVKCVVTPNVSSLLRALAEECRSGAWTVETEADGARWMERRGGRLLTACKTRAFSPAAREAERS
jgi:cell wall assembly regulator SMI1